MWFYAYVTEIGSQRITLSDSLCPICVPLELNADHPSRQQVPLSDKPPLQPD